MLVQIMYTKKSIPCCIYHRGVEIPQFIHHMESRLPRELRPQGVHDRGIVLDTRESFYQV
jgi:hypothetical protein